LFSLLLVLFPMIFVAIGAGGISFASAAQIRRHGATQPIPSGQVPAKGPVVPGSLFHGLFVMGSGLFYIFLPCARLSRYRAPGNGPRFRASLSPVK